MEIIARVEIPKYIRQVQMSKSRRAVYFEWTGTTIKAKGYKVPRAFFKDKFNYPDDILIEDLKDDLCITIMNEKGKIVDYIKQNIRLPLKPIHKWKYRLYRKEDDNRYRPVIANTLKVGTPNIYLINGQDIYNGFLQDHAKGYVIDKIKECYLPHISTLPVITEYPIQISCEVHDTIKNNYASNKDLIGHRWDVDNLVYPYLKAFPDLLVKEGKIKDDDRLHLPGSIGAIFVPIEKHEDRKLVFIISKVERPEIIENETFKAFHQEDFTIRADESVIIERDKDGKPLMSLSLMIINMKEGTSEMYDKTKHTKEFFDDENI